MNARPLLSQLIQNDEQHRREAVLETLLRIVGVVGLGSLGLAIVFPEFKTPVLINSIGFIVTSFVLWRIGKRAGVAVASLIFIIVAIGLVIISRAILPRDAAIVLTSAFLIVVPGAGLLLGRRGIWLAVGIGIISTWADTLLRLAMAGWSDSLLLLATALYTILFGVCGVFMEIFARMIEAALGGMQAKERSLAQRNADLEHEVLVRTHVEAQLLKLTGSQQSVLDATTELLTCPTADDLWRRAVELARERLGVDRCAIFLLSDDGKTMVGTFGTDMNGRTTDERGFSFDFADTEWVSELDDSAAKNAKNYWAIQYDAMTTEWRDGKQHLIDRNWIAWTPLRSRDGQRMGVFFNDAQRTGAAPNSALQDTIAVYCAQVSNIAEAKRLEDELKHANAELEERVLERTEQLELERDHLEVRVTERTREMSKLIDASKIISSTLDLQPLLKLILEQLEQVVPCNASSVGELLETELRFLSVIVPVPDQEIVWSMPFDRSHDLDLVALVDTHEPVLISDALGDSAEARALQVRYLAALIDIRPTDMGSVIHVPLLLADQLLGVMSVRHPQRGFYNEAHVSLMRGFASFAAIAIANARLHEDAVRNATSAERTRLARELHDSVSQALYGIVLGSRTAMEQVQRANDADADGAVTASLQYVLSLSEGALSEMRALIFELRPESLAQEGLLAALRKQAHALVTRHHIDLRLDIGETEASEPTLSLERKEALYRIALEAIQNTLKHANASIIELCLRSHPNHVVLQVHDNGFGFNDVGDFPGHYGLQSMRERAHRLNGKVAIDSAPGKGTRITVYMPCAT